MYNNNNQFHHHNHYGNINQEEERIPEDEIDKSTNYYALLNVSPDASEIEIKVAYKKLATSFHPDKFQGEYEKYLAHNGFQSIQKAYDILSDSNLRYLYDKYGESATRVGWQLFSKPLRPEEIEKQYEEKIRKMREKEFKDILDLKTETMMNLSMENGPIPTLKGFAAESRWKIPVNESTTIRTRTSVSSADSSGSFTPILTHEGLNGSEEIQLHINNYPSATVSVSRTVPGNVHVTGAMAVSSSLKNFPGINITAKRPIGSQTVAYMDLQKGMMQLNEPAFRNLDNSCSIGIVRNFKNGSFRTEIRAGPLQSHIQLVYQRNWSHGLSTKAYGGLYTNLGVNIGLAANKSLTEDTKVGMGIDLNGAQGLSFRLNGKYIGQKLSIPIHVSSYLDLDTAAILTLVPTALYFLVDTVYLRHRREEEHEETIRKLREENKEWLHSRRSEALESLDLLKSQALKKIEYENSIDGLIIQKAIYGNLKKKSTSCIDVTIQIQSMVSQSQLIINEGYPKSSLMGFYDPCLGEKKQLSVNYIFRGNKHKVVVDDTAGLVAPLKGHIIA